MKKYKLAELVFEVTRKCNRECSHCMRGDAQNITMDKALVDKVFGDVADVRHIAMSGGEVLLELDTVEYIIRKLVDSPWATKLVEVTTNGTIHDKRIIDAFESFCLNKKAGIAALRISNDKFHDRRESAQAFQYYKPLVDAANKRIWQQSGHGGILLQYTNSPEENKKLRLHYMGRAVDIVDNGNGQYQHGTNVDYPYTYQHRIKIVGGTIPCALQVSANGNLSFWEDITYNKSDEISMGNVMDAHISNLIDYNNHNCLLLCSETDRLHVSRWEKYFSETRYTQGVMLQFDERVCRRILELRCHARQRFPHVPSDEIISALPFPSTVEVNSLALQMYEKCPYYRADVVVKVNKYSGTPQKAKYLASVCQMVLTWLNREPESRKNPYWLFGDDNDIEQSEPFLNLELLERKYKNTSINTETINFPCNMNQGNVSYERELSTDGRVDFDGLYRLLKSKISGGNNE